MRIMQRIARDVGNLLHRKVSDRREPDVIIGSVESPYLFRWHIIPRNRFFNVYLHRFLRSDDDRALHDHPWLNLSFLLSGCYTEHTIRAGGVNRKVLRQMGDLKLRLPTAAHRIELTHGKCWTLFITGPRMRAWGFHCPDAGWRHWETFVSNVGKIHGVGRGCD